jgi:hypothetical protein
LIQYWKTEKPMGRKSGKPAFLSPLIRTAIMLISLSFGQTSRNLQSLMATLWISPQVSGR